MPASEKFQTELNAAYTQLRDVQYKLASLKGQADMEGLPAEVGRTLQRKHKVIDFAREDLREIPAIIAQAEAQQ